MDGVMSMLGADCFVLQKQHCLMKMLKVDFIVITIDFLKFCFLSLLPSELLAYLVSILNF